MAHLRKKVSQDVQGLSPFQRTFAHGDPLHRVRVHILLIHLVLHTVIQGFTRVQDSTTIIFPSTHLIWGDTVELGHESHSVFLLDQDALQSLLVLLHLQDRGTTRMRDWVTCEEIPSRRASNDLLGTLDEDAVQDEVGPKQRPLALNVFKQLQLRRLVVQAVWILWR